MHLYFTREALRTHAINVFRPLSRSVWRLHDNSWLAFCAICPRVTSITFLVLDVPYISPFVHEVFYGLDKRVNAYRVPSKFGIRERCSFLFRCEITQMRRIDVRLMVNSAIRSAPLWAAKRNSTNSMRFE